MRCARGTRAMRDARASHHWQASQSGSSMPQNLMSLAACDRSSLRARLRRDGVHRRQAAAAVAPPGTAFSWLAFTVDFSACVAPQRAQVVGRLQAAQPGELVGLVELLARGAGHVDVERLRLVDPLLAARGGLDQPRAARPRRRSRRAPCSSWGTRSIARSEPSKCFRSITITSSHRPRRFRSRTRYSLTTVNSPDRLDLTDRLPKLGSIEASTPMMLEIVAVGAMATQLRVAHAVAGDLLRAARPSPAWSSGRPRRSRRAPRPAGRACPAAGCPGPTASRCKLE